MRDFSLDIYRDLLEALLIQVKNFYTFNSFVLNDIRSGIVLRHDVDALPYNSLRFAEIESDNGIVGTYYFRILAKSNNPEIIKKIASLGHEIGYHYEDLDLRRGNLEEAIKSFKNNLTYFRELYPVKTICMHGSPMSKYDNRKLWEKYDYRDFGVLAEPYFDVDYTKVLYLTDTGRRWDGEMVSVRDKVSGKVSASYAEATAAKGNRYSLSGNKPEERGERREERGEEIIGMTKDGKLKVYRDENGILKHNFHSTFDIIRAAEEKILPDQMMITVHPQRWNNNLVSWTQEMIFQNIKNQIKRFFVK